MYSYLTNRQYHKLTACQPESLKTQQPQIVYLPSHANSNLKNQALQMMGHLEAPNKQNRLKKHRKKTVPSFSITQQHQNPDCCPTCLNPDNIPVKYHSKKHICISCRKSLRDEHGNLVKLFLNKQGQIVCLGVVKSETKPANQIYYHADYSKLFYSDKSVFVTFAAPQQMVVLLRSQSQNDLQ